MFHQGTYRRCYRSFKSTMEDKWLRNHDGLSSLKYIIRTIFAPIIESIYTQDMKM